MARPQAATLHRTGFTHPLFLDVIFWSWKWFDHSMPHIGGRKTQTPMLFLVPNLSSHRCVAARFLNSPKHFLGENQTWHQGNWQPLPQPPAMPCPHWNQAIKQRKKQNRFPPLFCAIECGQNSCLNWSSQSIKYQLAEKIMIQPPSSVFCFVASATPWRRDWM